MKHRGYSTLSTWRWILSQAGSFFSSVFTTNVHGRSKHLLNLNTMLSTFEQCFKRKLKQTLLHLIKHNEQKVVLPFPLLYVYSRLWWNCSARGTLLLNSCSPLPAMSQLTFSGEKLLNCFLMIHWYCLEINTVFHEINNKLWWRIQCSEDSL